MFNEIAVSQHGNDDGGYEKSYKCGYRDCCRSTAMKK